MWLRGPLKCSKSHFIPVHVFLHFGTFGLEVLQLILASKLSELEQFENFAANESKNDTKIKMMPLPSIKKCVLGWAMMYWQ